MDGRLFYDNLPFGIINEDVMRRTIMSRYKRTKYPTHKQTTETVANKLVKVLSGNGNGHNGNGHNGSGKPTPADLNNMMEMVADRTRTINEAIIKAETENVEEQPPLMKLDEKCINAIQHIKKRMYLQKYSERGIHTEAVKYAGVDWSTPYTWLDNDPLFKATYLAAKKVATDNLEREIWRRGQRGIKSPIYHQGRLCGFKREYSDTLLIFAAKGAMPEKYKEGNQLNVNMPIDIHVSFGDTVRAGGGFIVDTEARKLN
jgi:hypothetical protein